MDRISRFCLSALLLLLLCTVPAATGTPRTQASVIAHTHAPAITHPRHCHLKHNFYARSRSRTHKKMIALTFDDGPSAYTLPVAKILRHYHASATFFVVGENVAGRTDILRYLWEHGHQLGNHSWTHSLCPSADELRRSNRAIVASAGSRPCIFRPPVRRLQPATSQSRPLHEDEHGYVERGHP